MWELCNERVCREFEWAVKGESFFVKAPIWSAKRHVLSHGRRSAYQRQTGQRVED